MDILLGEKETTRAPWSSTYISSQKEEIEKTEPAEENGVTRMNANWKRRKKRLISFLTNFSKILF